MTEDGEEREEEEAKKRAPTPVIVAPAATLGESNR